MVIDMIEAVIGGLVFGFIVTGEVRFWGVLGQYNYGHGRNQSC